MDQLITLLLGVLLAAAVFAAFLFSLAQTVRTSGALRIAHVAALVATLAVMAALTWTNPWAARAAAVALAAAGAWLIFAERGWNKLLHVVQLLAGLAIVAGLPFAG